MKGMIEEYAAALQEFATEHPDVVRRIEVAIKDLQELREHLQACSPAKPQTQRSALLKGLCDGCATVAGNSAFALEEQILSVVGAHMHAKREASKSRLITPREDKVIARVVAPVKVTEERKRRDD